MDKNLNKGHEDNAHGKGKENFKVIGNWSDQSKQLKKTYPQLSDADLKFETGQENDLLHRMEIKLSKSREEVIDIIIKGQTD